MLVVVSMNLADIMKKLYKMNSEHKMVYSYR